jgi:hypothetical protein
MLSRLRLDSKRGRVSFDAVLGFDQLNWASFSAFVEPLSGWKAPPLTAEAARAPLTEGFIPVDTGFFAWMVDLEQWKKTGLPLPRTWKELLALPATRKWWALEDPRTSVRIFLGRTKRSASTPTERCETARSLWPPRGAQRMASFWRAVRLGCGAI